MLDDATEADAAAVYAQLETLFGKEDAEKIGAETVRTVCRNVQQLQCGVYGSIAEENVNGINRIAGQLSDNGNFDFFFFFEF